MSQAHKLVSRPQDLVSQAHNLVSRPQEGGQKELSVHRDGALMTFSLLLNRPDDFAVLPLPIHTYHGFRSFPDELVRLIWNVNGTNP